MSKQTTVNSNESSSGFDVNQLQDAVSLAIEHSCHLGASAAEAGVSAQQGLSVTARLGEVETVEHNRDRTLSVSVYNGQCKGSASCGDIRADSIVNAVNKAWSIATHTEPDSAAGIADASRMATVMHELDMWHPETISAEQLIERSLQMEQIARDTDHRIRNSEGASVGCSQAMGVYGNSHGFIANEKGTSFHQYVALIASEQEGSEAMQRDYSWDSKRRFMDLGSPEQMGKQAAERVLRRLGASSIKSTQSPVLFVPETARSLLGSFISAVSGGAQYQKASFLLDQIGEDIFPSFINIVENPHQRCGVNSANYDSDGVATGLQNALIDNGRLVRYVLSQYSANRLNSSSTGNAGGVRNLQIEPGSQSFDELVQKMDRGLIVTDMMGEGVNMVNGDYSRGASGFWVEKGKVVQPVEEVTIAGNLRDMFADIVALGNDVDVRRNLQTPSWLVSEMMIAGA